MFTNRIARRSMIAVTGLSLAAGGTFWACTARADEPKMDDKMMGDHQMMAKPLSDDQKKMVMEHMDKMKSMAADPEEAKKMTAEAAQMMVAENMAKSLSMDPAFQKECKDMMDDPAMKKIHDDAMAMAKDPEQMKKLEGEVTADPKAMKAVVHQAMMMDMMHDKMMKMDDKMK